MGRLHCVQAMKFFNTAGPCRPDWHYMLPATERLQADNIDRMIRQRSYFVVYVPRQVGKTTAMLELARELTANGEYVQQFQMWPWKW